MSGIIGYHANFVRGQMLRASGRSAEARAFLSAAIEANPDVPEPYVELALAEADIRGRRLQAIQAINRALSLAPNSAEIQGHKALLLSLFDRPAEALAQAESALRMDPFCYRGLLGMANAYTKLKRWSAAESTARRMLELNPNDTSALNLLAQAQRLQNVPAECRKTIARILELTPNDSFGHANAGYEALKAGDHLRANRHFVVALREDPNCDFARRGLLQSFRARMFVYAVGFNLLANLPEIGAGGRALFIVLNIATGGLFLGLVVLWLIFAFTLQPLSNFFLLLQPAGRRALTKRERMLALLTGAIASSVVAAAAAAHLGVLVIFFGGYLLLFALSVLVPQWIDAWRAHREEKLVTDACGV